MKYGIWDILCGAGIFGMVAGLVFFALTIIILGSENTNQENQKSANSFGGVIGALSVTSVLVGGILFTTSAYFLSN